MSHREEEVLVDIAAKRRGAEKTTREPPLRQEAARAAQPNSDILAALADFAGMFQRMVQFFQ